MSGALRILVIDDDETVRSALRGELLEAGGDAGDGCGESAWEVHCRGFEGVAAALRRIRPDMVVLDLVEGQIPNVVNSGNHSFEQIRDIWFCPVVVYTGFADARTFGEHPQIIQVIKGKDSDQHVLAELRKFAPLARAIRSVHDDFDARIREALHDSVDALGRQAASATDEQQDAALGRAVRRQVAARVDLGASAGLKLRAWERLVVPPLGADLLTADLLRHTDAEWIDESAFRLVLTPSCDMTQSGGRRPRTERVLVAACEPLVKLGQEELKPGKRPKSKQRKRLRSILTQGMAGGQLVIPEFKGHVPLMAANLKRLELINWNEIDLCGGPSDHTTPTFVRVASTDSPFREMVVWAYLSVTGRPGMPETDVDQWVSDISDGLAAKPE